MLNKEAKEFIAKLELPFSAVAVKFSYNPPAGIEECTEGKPLCAYMRLCQDKGKPFYVNVENEACMGSYILGASNAGGLAKSGMIGFEHGFFRSAAGNAHLYFDMPRLIEGTCNYVTFSPVEQCTFSPDLVFFVADIDQAALLMRASNWTSGDLWEQKSSIALSCGWLFAYPYISGKVNHCITGIHFGLSKLKLYPKGLHIISVPFQKLDELLAGLAEMEWELIPLKDDEESCAIAAAGDAKLADMQANPDKPFALDTPCRQA